MATRSSGMLSYMRLSNVGVLSVALLILPYADAARPLTQEEGRQLSAAAIAKGVCSIAFISEVSSEVVDRYFTQIASYYNLPHDLSATHYEIVNRRVRVTIDEAQREAEFLGPHVGCVVVSPSAVAGKRLLELREIEGHNRVLEASRMAPYAGGKSRESGAQATPISWLNSVEVDVEAVQAIADHSVRGGKAEAAAVLVFHAGEIVGEAYGHGASVDTVIHGYSMTKAIQSLWIGILEASELLSVDDSDLLPAWENDARSQIQLRHLLEMTSGLNCKFPVQEPPHSFYQMGWHLSIGWPDHSFTWTAAEDAYALAAARPLADVPGEKYEYKDCDPSVAGSVIRRSLVGAGFDYHKWPRSSVFDSLGMYSMFVGMDPSGNFLTAADGHATARDWGRLALIYMNEAQSEEGVLFSSNFKRYLFGKAGQAPKSYVGGLSSNANCRLPLPTDAYVISGGRTQRLYLIPSLDTVVVRLAFDSLDIAKGRAAREQETALLSELMGALSLADTVDCLADVAG